MNDIEIGQIESQIVRNMNEGVLVLHESGRIILVNHTAERILEKTMEEMNSGPFANLFFGYSEEDSFNKLITDCVDATRDLRKKIIPYHINGKTKYLSIITSKLQEEERVRGIIIVVSDVTELVEVRKHLKMMKRIEVLNQELKNKNDFIRKVFGRYLSDEIVEQILDKPNGLAIGGKKANITVLMSDLRGFTALCEQMEADMVMDMLNHYLTHMGKIINKYHGTIIEYAGDGILATFGAPIASENHALDAVLAALEMQAEMSKVNSCNLEKGYPHLNMGIGINTGDVVIGNMGSKYAIKYNLIGRCVNLCGRIEGYTVAGQIFISPSTKERIPHKLILDDQFKVHPKGIKDSLIISSVRGIGEPYNISIQYETEPLVKAKDPIKTKVYRIDGKHISKKYFFAWIEEYSFKQLVVMSEKKLHKMEDILLRERLDIYGKVIAEHKDGSYLIEITGRAHRSVSLKK